MTYLITTLATWPRTLSCHVLRFSFHQRIYGLEAGKAQERFLVQGGKYDIAFPTSMEAMNVHPHRPRLTCVCRVSCVVCRVSCVVCRVSCVVCRVCALQARRFS
jgi:hypothetical protein